MVWIAVTRKVVIGMIRAAALAAAFFLASGAIPVLGTVLMIFAPQPILGYAVGRPQQMRRAVAAVGLAGALVGLVTGPLAAMVYAMSFGPATVVMCYLLKRRQRFETIVMVTAGASLAACGAGALALSGSPAALARAVHGTLAMALSRGEQFYRLFGIKPQVEAQSRRVLLELTVRLTPALGALGLTFVALVNLLMFWRWVGRHRLDYSLFGDLSRWRAPEWLIWVLLAAGFALFAPLSAVKTLALQPFVWAAGVYLCQGLAILAFYLKLLAMPSALRALIYLLATLQPLFAGLLCLAGVFDMWVDFRRLKPPSEEAGRFGNF